MDQKDEYADDVKMYHDVLEVEEKAPRKNVEYFKKVEKVTSKTVIKEGSNPHLKKLLLQLKFVKMAIIQNKLLKE